MKKPSHYKELHGMEIDAPSDWTCIDFISDVHLRASDPATFQAWQQYVSGTIADAVFILGDLFEIWVGDDILSIASSFEKQCVDVLRQASTSLKLFIQSGNRDFLMGPRLMSACGAVGLDDPTTLAFAGQRWLLTHGDAWCIDDIAYMQFRAQVRSQAWQHAFLRKPLSERIEIAGSLREQSEARKKTYANYADVDSALATVQLESARAKRIIHGHTHRPARHALPNSTERLVLSDWDVSATPSRSEVLRLRRTDSGRGHLFTAERIPAAMAMHPPRITPTLLD